MELEQITSLDCLDVFDFYTLKSLCKKKNIRIASNDSKADIIEKIELDYQNKLVTQVPGDEMTIGIVFEEPDVHPSDKFFEKLNKKIGEFAAGRKKVTILYPFEKKTTYLEQALGNANFDGIEKTVLAIETTASKTDASYTKNCKFVKIDNAFALDFLQDKFAYIVQNSNITIVVHMDDYAFDAFYTMEAVYADKAIAFCECTDAQAVAQYQKNRQELLRILDEIKRNNPQVEKKNKIIFEMLKNKKPLD